MVVLKDLRRGRPPEIAIARQLFGLSRSEADIMALLGEGYTAAQIATERVVSEHTVRTQSAVSCARSAQPVCATWPASRPCSHAPP